jgi:PelA/Pel-15E family pectate lyase
MTRTIRGALALVICAIPTTLAAQPRTPALLGAPRLAALPTAERAQWAAYLARSDSARARDRAVLDGELRTLGRAAMDSAPYRKDDFGDDARFTAAWWRTADAARLGAALLSYQTASGGWSKHVDYDRGPRAPGQSYYGESARWNYIATLDNHATTGETQYLLALQQAQPAPAWEAGLVRAAGYLLAAQMPNGCWPQVWPLQGSYHDAITFNDDAVAEAARTMERLAAAPGGWMPDSLRQRLQRGADHAVQCLLRTQVVIAGRRTIWGQQHDPLTLAPTQGRSYELPSLATAESAGILDFLIPRAARDTAVAAAVRDAVRWLDAHVQRGVAYEQDRGVFPAGPEAQLWARLYTLDTQRPLFANRDGIPRTSLEQLTDRRTGYNWYGTWPQATLHRAARAGLRP